MSSGPAILSDACYNCGATLAGNFCAACGQKGQPLDPDLGDLLHDLSHELLHFDGKIVRSIWTLLMKPGVLTRDYVAGRRVRWVSPIRLYLVFSVAYFGFIALDHDTLEVSHSFSRLMFVLLPVFAWLVSAVSVQRRNFPQHLYFALHVHAAWFAAWLIREGGATVLSPRFMASTRWLGELMLLYSAAYVVLAFRKGYDEKFWKAALKMAAVVTAYMVVVILAGIAVSVASRRF